MKEKIIPSAVPVDCPPTATEFERFSALTRQVLSVPKTEIDRREAEWKKAKEFKKLGRANDTPSSA